MLYIIIGILLFGLLIAVHEAGHFFAAKALDVQVNEFAIGMGPALFSRQRGETLYALRILPIGGYCAMEGEDGESDNPRAFSRKAPWKRLIILAAGSAMNLVAGFLLVVILFTAAGSYAVPVVRHCMEGFPCAGETGLLPGDRILEINGKTVRVYSDVSTYLSAAGEGPKDLVVEREGEQVVLNGLPLNQQEYTVNGETVTMYGLYFDTETPTFPGVLRQSWNTCLYLGEAGSQGGSVAAGLQNVCYVIGLIAINLAIMNMLPIPALDGGRIFFLLVTEGYHLLTRRTLDPKYEAYLHAGGFVLLLMLMAVITLSDILKLVN